MSVHDRKVSGPIAGPVYFHSECARVFFFFLWFACVNAVCVCDVLNTFLQISNISVQLQDVILILVFLGI